MVHPYYTLLRHHLKEQGEPVCFKENYNQSIYFVENKSNYMYAYLTHVYWHAHISRGMCMQNRLEEFILK